MKLRKLLNVGEPLGPLHGAGAGPERRQQVWPSTVAYVARLMIHRYAMLGVLDEDGFPLDAMGLLADTRRDAAPGRPARAAGRPAVPGVRQRHDDPQGRLRLLHFLRLHRRLWVARHGPAVACRCRFRPAPAQRTGSFGTLRKRREQGVSDPAGLDLSCPSAAVQVSLFPGSSLSGSDQTAVAKGEISFEMVLALTFSATLRSYAV